MKDHPGQYNFGLGGTEGRILLDNEVWEEEQRRLWEEIAQEGQEALIAERDKNYWT